MKKKLSLFVCICFLICALPLASYAASYDQCDSPMFGWGTSVSVSYDKPIGSKHGIGGLNNSWSSAPAEYTFTDTFTHSISCTSELSNELDGSINFNSGKVKGGLGAKINSSFSISSNYTHTYSQSYKATVPAYKNLTLYSQAYGVKLSVYAIYHTCWIHGTKVNGTIGIPQYQKFVPQITR